MGTSRNDPSPRAPEWLPTFAVLGNPKFPIERQSLEVWTAASQELGGALYRDLSSPIVAHACEIANSRAEVFDALDAFDNTAAYEYKSGLAVEFARRALARSAEHAGGGRTFASELLAETVTYFVSRDLPSYVGAKGRIATAAEAIALKDSIGDVARRAVERAGEPPMGTRAWRRYVRGVIENLS